MNKPSQPRRSRIGVLIFVLTAVSSILTQVVNVAAATKYRVIYTFQGGSDGAAPYGGLVFDATGNLYGTTYFGGNNATGCGNGTKTGCGTAFMLTHASGGWTKSPLYAFCSQDNCADGALPNGDLVFGTNGALYGTTFQGGSCSEFYGCGVAFQLAPDSKGDWQYTVLYAFQGGSDAVNPDGGLIFDKQGDLYGTAGGINPAFGDTLIQAGAIFVLTPDSGGWTERVLYTCCKQGFSPASGLVWGPGGDLYGATYYGGANSFACFDNGCGVLFKLTQNSKNKWRENALRILDGADGAHVLSALTRDGQGNLYGTTDSDGAFGDGTAFQLAPQPNGKWKYSVLHEFSTGRLGGGLFRSALTLDAKGNLYGTTWTGGTGNCNGQGCGLIYKLTRGAHNTWKYTDLYDFTGGIDGGWPTSRVTFDDKGNLYGVTAFGGDMENGVVFEVTP